MATFNFNKIRGKVSLPKAGDFIRSSRNGKAFNLKDKKDFNDIIDRATARFSYCFTKAKEDAGFNNNAMIAIGDIDFVSPIEDTNIQGRYIIYGFIDENMRESLVPQLYPEGAKDMAALMNNGYTASNQVYGIWHGKKTASLTARVGKYFVQQSISDFNGNYGSDFNATAELVNKTRFEP